MFNLAGLRATTSLDSSAAKGEEPTASNAHDAREATHPQAISSTMVFLCAFSSFLCAFSSPRWQRWQLSPTSSLQGFSALSAGKNSHCFYIHNLAGNELHTIPRSWESAGCLPARSCYPLSGRQWREGCFGGCPQLSPQIDAKGPAPSGEQASRLGGTSVLVPI